MIPHRYISRLYLIVIPFATFQMSFNFLLKSLEAYYVQHLVGR